MCTAVPQLLAECLEKINQRAGQRLSKHGGGIAVGHFSTKFLALKKDDAAIGTGLVSEVHIGVEPSPAKEFDGAAGDLSRCAVERAIEGLEIRKNLVVGCLALVADSGTSKLAFGGHESHGVDLDCAKPGGSVLQFIGLRPAGVFDFHESVGF